jgi:glucose-6-phosphate isomerase
MIPIQHGEKGLAPFPFLEALRAAALPEHADRLKGIGLIPLQSEGRRTERWVLEPKKSGWRFDFTKQLIDEEAWRGLEKLAHLADWKGARDLQFAGAPINHTEGRSVLHMALRGAEGDAFQVDGRDVMGEVLSTRKAFLGFAENVRNGAYSAADGSPFTHVINIGIGGSDLGPVMVHEALAPLRRKEGAPLDVRFVSNVDPLHLDKALHGIVPERTMVVIVSKTFTTQETMANAHRALAWLKSSLGDSAAHHLAAVSSNVEGAAEMGIPADRVFGFGNWVGGRFSLWGPVGLAIALGSGAAAFEAMLTGARRMDLHFQEADCADNVPLHLALLEVWNVNLLGGTSRGVLPYAQALHRLPAYLQQAEMESNGKSVGRDSLPISWQTHPVVWGEPGTNGQHAFHQLLHQGTDIHPVDFIAIAKPMGGDVAMHRLLLDNAIAQAEAFCVGRKKEDVFEEMSAAGFDLTTVEEMGPHRVFEGGRPSTFILGDALNPDRLGGLIAAYEHKIFLEGVFWNLYSYDQWGVELGKAMAKALDSGQPVRWTAGTDALIQASRQGSAL